MKGGYLLALSLLGLGAITLGGGCSTAESLPSGPPSCSLAIDGHDCTSDDECCSDFCGDGVCQDASRSCVVEGSSCTSGIEHEGPTDGGPYCCGTSCVDGVCSQCFGLNQHCSETADCCAGYTCFKEGGFSDCRHL